MVPGLFGALRHRLEALPVASRKNRKNLWFPTNLWVEGTNRAAVAASYRT